MKTATIPSLRVEPKLRQDAENILYEGENLSSFMEESLRAGILYRRAQQEFLARGLMSRDEAKKTGVYLSAEDVLDKLTNILADAEDKSN